MIERLTPEEYEQRQIDDTTPVESYLDKQLAKERLIGYYARWTPLEEPEPQPEPQPQPQPEMEPSPIAEEQPRNSVPWGLIGLIAVTGLIALSIVAVVAVKK